LEPILNDDAEVFLGVFLRDDFTVVFLQHRLGVVRLFRRPNEAVQGDRVRTVGMAQNVLRPLHAELVLQPSYFKIEAASRHNRTFGVNKRGQYRGEVTRNLKQLPPAIFGLGEKLALRCSSQWTAT